MIKYSNLNDAQKRAVIDESKHLRIIAGAGSGKTRVLTMRIAYLIEELNKDPRNILAITFTNKAANEMKSRINEMLKEKGTGAFISTIHSLCVRILSEDIRALNYPKNFTIVDSDDQKQILKEAYKAHSLDKRDYSYGSMLEYISNNKCEDVSFERAYELALGDERQTNKAKVYEYYQKRLASVYGLDFDDLIIWTIRLFDLFPDIKNKWSSRFHYIMVDEFQDVDRLQYKLIKQLSCVHDNIYVVGDPDQTIYTWRGADVGIIINFERDFNDTKTIFLNENYRSTGNILNGANSVIKNNKMRLEKELFSSSGMGDKIVHKSLGSEDEESYFVAARIEKLHDQGYAYKDIAVLYRSNYLSRNIEKVLMEKQIPYVIYGSIRFYERAEIKDMLSYLRMITTNDDLAFIRTINNPKRGIGQKTIDSILELARQEDSTMFDVVAAGKYGKNKEVLSGYIKMINRWKEALKTNDEDLEHLFQMVLDESGYRMMLENEKETERLENIKALMDDIVNYQKVYPGSKLDDYLQNIALYTEKNSEKSSDSVNLLTVHSAKGLEFNVVFVIGLSENIFPSRISMEEGLKGLEEERRLAYVAYTRAREKLFLTDNTAYSFVTQTSKSSSRFIDEIDEKCINHLNEEERKKFSIFDEPINKKSTASSGNVKSKFKKGDIVVHSVFKEGVVLKEENGILEIAFPFPHGVKKILASHPSIRKKELLS